MGMAYGGFGKEFQRKVRPDAGDSRKQEFSERS